MRECEIIDMHAHIFPEKVAERAVESIGKYYGIEMTGGGTSRQLIDSGEKINVSRYVVHSTATKMEQVQTINDFIAREQAENSCFIGFGTLHSKYEDIESEVDRVISLGLKGIKLHPEFQEFYIDDDEMMPIYSVLEGRLPILMHMGDEEKTSSSPERLAKVLDKFPRLTVIAAHFGGYQMWDDAMDFLMGRNVYYDTSSSLKWLEPQKVEKIIRKHGVEKILFGSDYPMWTHEEEMERFNKLQLTTEERERILWKNAKKLLSL